MYTAPLKCSIEWKGRKKVISFGNEAYEIDGEERETYNEPLHDCKSPAFSCLLIRNLSEEFWMLAPIR
jgi:hypothetical protein